MVNQVSNEVLNDIVNYAARKLQTAYGYCGVASGPDMAMLNSDDKQGNDIKINITLEKEAD